MKELQNRSFLIYFQSQEINRIMGVLWMKITQTIVHEKKILLILASLF